MNFVGDNDTESDTYFIVKATDPYTRGGMGRWGVYNSVSVFAVT